MPRSYGTKVVSATIFILTDAIAATTIPPTPVGPYFALCAHVGSNNSASNEVWLQWVHAFSLEPLLVPRQFVPPAKSPCAFLVNGEELHSTLCVHDKLGK